MFIHKRSVAGLMVGIGGIIMLMFALLYLALTDDTRLRETHRKLQVLYEKTEQAFVMREAIRKRAFSLAMITRMQDFFERDAELQRFSGYALEFVEARERLIAMGLGPEERSILEDFQKAVDKDRPLVEKTMKILVEGRSNKQAEDMALQAINVQKMLFTDLGRLVDVLRKLESEQVENAGINSEKGRRRLILLGGLMFLTSIVIAVIIVRRERTHMGSLLAEISERRKAEDQVREFNASLELRVEERTTQLNKSRDVLLEAQRVAAIGSWEWLVSENRFNWSRETFHLFGIDPGQVEPDFTQLIERYLPDDAERVKRAVDATLKNDAPYDIQFKIIRTDGRRLIAQAIGKVERDADGAPLRMYGTLQDITAQKEAEEMLRKLSRAVEQSPSSVFITDTDGVIEYVNSKFTEMMGYSFTEAIGQTPRIIASDKTPKELILDLWSTIGAGREWRGEIVDRRKDGTEFWAYVTIAPVKDDGDVITHYVAMHEDIGQRKQAEFNLNKALQEADIANRSKSELLANMSHELRTPLNAIIGFSSSMKEEIFGPLGHWKYREYLDDISSSGEHLLGLISDILDVSAIEAGKVEINQESLDIGDLVAASVRLVKNRFVEGDVRLDINIDKDLAEFRADRRRIVQIIVNLLSNAVKFTKPGGRVTIRVSSDGQDGHLFIITDTGIGMTGQEIDKAMSWFGQVDRGLVGKHEGTGLGLPLARKLVEMHGGVLRIASEKGRGTTVTLHFQV